MQQVPDVVHNGDGAGPKTRPARQDVWFRYQLQPEPQARVVFPVVPSFVIVKDLPLLDSAVIV